MRFYADQDRQKMPKARDDRLLALPTAPRRLDSTAEEKDQEALSGAALHPHGLRTPHAGTTEGDQSIVSGVSIRALFTA